ncbi:MAG TPA: energy transducer TonB [Nitrospiria bacterium]|jgi:protein TonB|nr:energy transducer TonB [Nitrospiria bacterium]
MRYPAAVRLSEIAKINQIGPAFLLSLALHGALISVSLIATVHRFIPHRPQIFEVILADWPREKSVGIPTPTPPETPSRPVQRPRPNLETPKVVHPEPVQETQPTMNPEIQSLAENPPVQFPIQSASTQSQVPDALQNHPASQDPAGRSLTPPQFDAAYLENPKPKYPATARKLGIQGTVVLRVFISVEGNPAEIRVEKSSGHPVLDQAALTAVKKWRFDPAHEGEAPVAAWVDVPIRFRLE